MKVLLFTTGEKNSYFQNTSRKFRFSEQHGKIISVFRTLTLYPCVLYLGRGYYFGLVINPIILCVD